MTTVKTGYTLTGITGPYRGLKFWPIEFTRFLKSSTDKFLVFNWSQAQDYFFNAHSTWNKLCLLASDRTSDAKSQPFVTVGKAVAIEFFSLLTLFRMVTRWSHFTSHSYPRLVKICRWLHAAYIMQLETCLLIAEADRDFVVCVNCLDLQNQIHLAIKNLLLFMAGWFLVEKCAAWQKSNRKSSFSNISFSSYILHFSECERRFKSLKRFWPYLMAFRSCISTGKLQ